jgi:putative ABC transport system permease protein
VLLPVASILQRKLRREMWQQRGQWLAIALVIAGGVSVCLMSLVNVASLEATRDAYYREQVFADVFVTLKRAPRHLHRQIQALDGVSRVSTRIEASARLEVPGYADPV